MDNKPVDKLNNKELLEILWKALNKSCINGSFNIEEAYTLKVVYDTLCNNTSTNLFNKNM
jgi:hypothetical protein